MLKPFQHFVNHITIMIDASGSMCRRRRSVVAVVDKEVTRLKQRSVELNQETRVSVYLFADKVTCLVFDQDVMRMNSIEGYYNPGGSTALCSAAVQAIADNKLLPELYGDHAFLLYCITDGEENASSQADKMHLAGLIKGLPDHWTVACLVPDAICASEAKKFGFPADSVAVWDTTSNDGMEHGVSQVTSSSIDNYMVARSKGVRGTKSFFNLKTASKAEVAQVLDRISPDHFRVIDVGTRDEGIQIRAFVERYIGSYQTGRSFYELVKPEEVQAGKQIAIQHVGREREVYTGRQARDLIGLPHGVTTKVRPHDTGEWRVFIQSTSVNRVLRSGSKLLTLV